MTQLNSTVVTLGDNAVTSLALRRHAAVHKPPPASIPQTGVEIGCNFYPPIL